MPVDTVRFHCYRGPAIIIRREWSQVQVFTCSADQVFAGIEVQEYPFRHVKVGATRLVAVTQDVYLFEPEYDEDAAAFSSCDIIRKQSGRFVLTSESPRSDRDKRALVLLEGFSVDWEQSKGCILLVGDAEDNLVIIEPDGYVRGRFAQTWHIITWNGEDLRRSTDEQWQPYVEACTPGGVVL